MNMQKITPCLWFDTEAEDAANFYISVFGNGKINSMSRYPEGAMGPAGSVMLVEFELFGQKFQGLNGGPIFKFTEAISMSVSCEDQKEVDELWEKLTADGGQAVQCGWLKDKYGLSWQIVPKLMDELMAKGDKDQQARLMAAMMKMIKIDCDLLQKAYDNK